MPVHEAWVLGALIMTLGLILGNLAGQWWARRQIDDARDEGRGEMIDQAIERVEQFGMVFRLSPNGKAVWCDAGSQWDVDGAQRALRFDEDVPRPDDSEGRTAEASGLATMPGAHAGPGHIYSELTALADRDELEALSEPLPPVDPDWHPKALARSEVWLAGCRAELGLVAA